MIQLAQTLGAIGLNVLAISNLRLNKEIRLKFVSPYSFIAGLIIERSNRFWLGGVNFVDKGFWNNYNEHPLQMTPQSGFCSDNKTGVRPNKPGFISVQPKQFLFLDTARYHTHIEN